MRSLIKKAFVLFLLSLSNSLPAQGYLKGDMIASGSVGFPHLNKLVARAETHTQSFRNSFRGAISITSIKGTNPIALKYEYAMGKHFGLGLSLCWWSVVINVKDHYDTGSGSSLEHQIDLYTFKLSSVSLGIRPNYHVPLKNTKGDLFIGCAIGLALNDMSVTYSSSQSQAVFTGTSYDFSLPNTLYLAPTIGYRYYLVNNFGLNVELGYEKGALFQLGAVYRFRPFKYGLPDLK